MANINVPEKTNVDDSVIKFIIGDYNMESDWDKFQKTIKDMGYEELLQMYTDRYAQLPENQKGVNKSLGLD